MVVPLDNTALAYDCADAHVTLHIALEKKCRGVPPASLPVDFGRNNTSEQRKCLAQTVMMFPSGGAPTLIFIADWN